jgi:predicted ribosome quality control (RQC) complex YloA/Tae2 family protein
MEIPSEVAEHVIVSAGYQIGVTRDAVNADTVFSALKQAEQEFYSMYQGDSNPRGYISIKTDKNGNEIFDDLFPFVFKKYESVKKNEYASYDEACDRYFTEIESQKIEQARFQQEKEAMSKVEAVKRDQAKRLANLGKSENTNLRKARLIEESLKEVEQCMLIIKSGLESKMDWKQLDMMLKEEKKKNTNPWANMIHKLNLSRNQIVLMLSDAADEDEQSDARATELVELDLSISAAKNASRYFNQKKIVRHMQRDFSLTVCRTRKKRKRPSNQRSMRSRPQRRRPSNSCASRRSRQAST